MLAAVEMLIDGFLLPSTCDSFVGGPFLPAICNLRLIFVECVALSISKLLFIMEPLLPRSTEPVVVSPGSVDL
jgi:hypothetical protein